LHEADSYLKGGQKQESKDSRTKRRRMNYDKLKVICHLFDFLPEWIYLYLKTASFKVCSINQEELLFI
jgi:hypothetical protein